MWGGEGLSHNKSPATPRCPWSQWGLQFPFCVFDLWKLPRDHDVAFVLLGLLFCTKTDSDQLAADF